MPSLSTGTFGPFSGDQPSVDVPDLAVRLRPWLPEEDAAAVRAVYEDPAVQRWHVRRLDSDAEARALLVRWRDGWAQHREAGWAVVDAADRVLGRVAVKIADPDGVGELAYWTAPGARGRGIARTAVRAAADWAFGARFHRLELVHSVANPASCRVATAAGFDPEAVLRESVLHTDGWHDMHLHARLAPPTQRP